MYPYDVNPNDFIQQALQPVRPQVPPYFPSTMMPTAPQYYGPTHQALSQTVQGLLNQNAGGLLGKPPAYTGNDNTNTIAAMYQQYLGRSPDLPGLQYWSQQANNGMPLSTVENFIRTSPEAKGGLWAAIQNDPNLARQFGSMVGGAYTPPAPTPYRIDWNAVRNPATDTTTPIKTTPTVTPTVTPIVTPTTPSSPKLSVDPYNPNVAVVNNTGGVVDSNGNPIIANTGEPGSTEDQYAGADWSGLFGDNTADNSAAIAAANTPAVNIQDMYTNPNYYENTDFVPYDNSNYQPGAVTSSALPNVSSPYGDLNGLFSGNNNPNNANVNGYLSGQALYDNAATNGFGWGTTPDLGFTDIGTFGLGGPQGISDTYGAAPVGSGFNADNADTFNGDYSGGYDSGGGYDGGNGAGDDRNGGYIGKSKKQRKIPKKLPNDPEMVSRKVHTGEFVVRPEAVKAVQRMHPGLLESINKMGPNSERAGKPSKVRGLLSKD